MILYILCVTILGVQLALGNFSGAGKHQSLHTDFGNSHQCVEEGFQPDARDCRKFYRCVNIHSNYENQIFFKNFLKPHYLAYEFECPQGTVFNPDYNVCDHPRQTRRAECGGINAKQASFNAPTNQAGQYKTPSQPQNGYEYSQPQRDLPPANSASVCRAPGYFPVQGNCNKFIFCLFNGHGYTKFEFSCGVGTVWDPERQICNYPYAVSGCGQVGNPGQGGYPGQGGNPGEGGYPGPGGNPGEGGYPGPGGNPGEGGYPGPGGNPGEGGYPGPGGYPGEGGYPGPGEIPEQSGSGGRPDSENTPQPPGPDSNKVFPGECKESGFFAVKGNCKKYVRCADNGNGGYSKFEFECGPGTVWDSQLDTCNYPSSVKGCENDKPDEDSNTSKPCNAGQSEQGNCVNQGSTPNPSSESTNEPQTSPSTKSPFTTQTTSMTTQTTSSSSYSNSSTTTIESQSSTTTFETSQMTTQSASQTTTTQSQTSKQPESTQQSSTNPTSTETSMETSTTPNYPSPPPGSSPCNQNTSSPIKCEKAGFFPDPSDCRKFYRCVDWDGDQGNRFSVHHFECSPGTIWDPALETCNHEQSVYPPRNCQNQDNQGSEKPTEETSTPISSTPEQSSTTPSMNKPSTTPSTTNTESTSPPSSSSPTTPDETEATSSPTDATDSSTSNPTDFTDPSPETTVMSSTDSTTPAETSPEATTMSSTDSTTPDSTSPETTVMSSTEPESTENTMSTDSTTSTPEESTSPENTSAPEESTSPEETSATEESTSPESTSITEEPTSPEDTSPTDSTSSNAPSTDPNTESPTEQPTESNTEAQTEPATDNAVTEPESTSNPTMPPKDPKCPDLKDNQEAFTCPTGFKRHPKNCQMFYQCTTSDEMEDVNIVTFSCKNNTYFDEKKIQCLPAEQTEPCNALEKRKRKARDVEGSPFLIYVPANKKLCPKIGYFPYEGDCRRFYKCLENDDGRIEGFMYQCPPSYIFSDITDRCEKRLKGDICGRSLPEVTETNLDWLALKVPTEVMDTESQYF